MSFSQPATRVDRRKDTPFLLKLFYRHTTFHRHEEFLPGSSLPAHLQIYTWPTCTLRELTHLLTSAMPGLLPRPAAGTRIAYRLVFPDTRGGRADGPARFMSKDLGSVVVGEDAQDRVVDGDADKQLQDVRFVIGDYVSCAVVPPLPSGEVAPPPSMSGMGGDGRGPPAPYGRGGLGQRNRGGMRAFGNGDFGSVPSGDWRRGERLPEFGGRSAPGPDRSYRGRGRGRGRW